MEAPENRHIVIKAPPPPKNVTGLIAQLKCIYANAHSVHNKQEGLEAIKQMENCDVNAVT